MSPTRSGVIVIMAGVIGTIMNAIVVNALTGTDVMAPILAPGRHVVAVATALLLIPIFRELQGTGAGLVAMLTLTLTLIPSLRARLVFGVAAPWSFVIGVNATYAVTATAIYPVTWRTRR